jgi:hypothetical protein
MHAPMSRLSLCLDCDTVYLMTEPYCPSCTGYAAMPLSRLAYRPEPEITDEWRELPGGDHYVVRIGGRA